jgi:hypothetical protein
VLEVVAIWEKPEQPSPVHLSMEYWLIEPPLSAEEFQVNVLTGVAEKLETTCGIIGLSAWTLE